MRGPLVLPLALSEKVARDANTKQQGQRVRLRLHYTTISSVRSDMCSFVLFQRRTRGGADNVESKDRSNKKVTA